MSTKQTPNKTKRKSPLDKGKLPQIFFGAGAVGLAAMTAWRNIEGRLAGATDTFDAAKEILAGGSMELVGASAAAFAIFRWKHNRTQAAALAAVAAFAYISNTTAAHTNIEAQTGRAINQIEAVGADVAVAQTRIDAAEERQDSLVERWNGVPRDEEALQAAYSWLADGLEGNPRNHAEFLEELTARVDYDQITVEIEDLTRELALAEVRANDDVHTTADDRVLGMEWGMVEVYGMQLVQAFGWWLADNSGRAPKRKPAGSAGAKTARRPDDDAPANDQPQLSDEERARRRRWAIARAKGERAGAPAPGGS